MHCKVHPALSDAWRARRAIVRGSLQAMAYCHERGIAHGALGPSSLLLNTYEDSRAAQLVVRLDNFGFARQSGACPVCCKDTLHKVSRLLAETGCKALTAASVLCVRSLSLNATVRCQ